MKETIIFNNCKSWATPVYAQVYSCIQRQGKKRSWWLHEIYPGRREWGSRLRNRGAEVASLPGKCLTGCCFQNRWWYYILSGLKTRGSPVGASRQPGEVCWSLRGAACTHIHNIHTQMVSMSPHSHFHSSHSAHDASHIVFNPVLSVWFMAEKWLML